MERSKLLKWEVTEKGRLDLFLHQVLVQVSRSKLRAHIERGAVIVNGEVKTKSGTILKPGDVVISEPPEETAPQPLSPVPMELDVRYEDDSILVVNKPRGLPVHPANTLTGATLVHGLLARGTALSEGSAEFRPGIVHRLDKETTGLLIVAKTDSAHADLAGQIQRREVERRYVAVVAGSFTEPQYTIDAPLARDPRDPLRRAVVEGGKSARTHVRLLETLEAGSLVSCRLESGRTHQIRVHLAHFGWPVLGDAIYAPRRWQDGPLQLHAVFLRLRHPKSGEDLAIFASPPPDFIGYDRVSEEQVTSWH